MPTTSLLKSGFVVMVGRSNAGKSTLLNALVGTKIAITSPKPQTTRRPAQGVVHDPRGQIVFVDTPGIFQKRGDKMTERLNQSVSESLAGIDLALYVADPTRAIGPEEERVLRILKDTKNVPVLMVINKIDEKIPYIEDYRALAPDFSGKVEVSALRGTHLKTLVTEIIDRLPVGEALYPEYQITNVGNREWYAELIREKVFLLLHQELPYACTVVIDGLEDEKTKAGEDMLRITARILVDNDAHKRMVIGAGGQKVKQIGSLTRRELEQVIDKKVFLDLQVEVDPHWPERIQ